MVYLVRSMGHYGPFDSELRNHLVDTNQLNPRINIIPMPKYFADGYLKILLYSFIAPFIHFTKLSQCSLFKSNQIDGFWTAAIAHYIFNIPLIVRAGYLPSSLINL